MDEISIKTSIIDYIGETNGGISIVIGLTVADDFTFESIFWFHPNGNRTLEAASDFLKLFGVRETDDLPFLKDLLDDIESILPDKNEIYETFLNGKE